MATAFTAAITVTNKSGQSKMYNYTGDDVTTAFLLAPSGSADNMLTATGGFITDLISSSIAGDCSQIIVYINGQDSGYIIYKALNGPTAVGGRQVQQNPIVIPAGAVVRFKQLT
jgi:hypothetical protein